MSLPNCKLCLTSPADKKNSHIIPKFLAKRLFEDTLPRHTVAIDNKGESKKLQDTPKENYILCRNCEKRIEIVETHFAPLLRQILQYKKYPKKFSFFKLGVQNYMYCNEIHPILYKLFIYSMVWRASISNLYEYKTFKIDEKVEEQIRKFLDKNLASTKSQLIQSVDIIADIPLFHSCTLKALDDTRGVFSLSSMSATTHALFLVDFVLLFYTDEASVGDVLSRFSNKQNENVIVALCDTLRWNDLNRQYISKMLNG